jgi:hypothetical protein
LFQQGRLITYFPHYPCIRFCHLNFPGKFRRKQRISLSSNFPLHSWWGKFRRQKRTSLPLIGELYLIENHRHNYGQYLTTPSRTLSNNHFASFYSLILNISIVGENSVYNANERGDVFLRVRIYEKCSYHNHKTIKQHSKQATHHSRFPR